jgi:hypothetical protein
VPILSVRELPSGSLMFYYMLNAQLFLLPQCILDSEQDSNKFYSSNNHGNQDVTLTKGVAQVF